MDMFDYDVINTTMTSSHNTTTTTVLTGWNIGNREIVRTNIKNKKKQEREKEEKEEENMDSFSYIFRCRRVPNYFASPFMIKNKRSAFLL